jgi:hypothetical protein
VAVEFWRFGKQGESCGGEAGVSHDSHRGFEKGCVKRTVYVKSVFKCSWSKGLEKPDTPQRAKITQTF